MPKLSNAPIAGQIYSKGGKDRVVIAVFLPKPGVENDPEVQWRKRGDIEVHTILLPTWLRWARDAKLAE